jgi:hypothetical protein
MDQLTFKIEGNRVEYRFRGILISSGGLASNEHFIPCIKAIRRALTGGNVEFDDGSFQRAKEIWNGRVEEKP